METDLFQLLNSLKKKGLSKDEINLEISKQFHSMLNNYGIPITGNFELTPHCCLDCKMCFVHLNKDQIKNKLQLTTNQWIKIMDAALEKGMMYAGLTGGECLLRPDFKELYLHLYNHGIKITVLTNGVLLDEKMQKFFSEYPPQKFMISLYGSNDDVYEKITGKRLCNRVKKNIEQLSYLYKKGLFDLSISITANKYMNDDLINIVKYLSNINVPYTVSPILMEPNENTERTCVNMNIDIDKYIEYLKYEIKTKKQKVIFSGNFNVESCYKNSFEISWDGIMVPSIFHKQASANVLEIGFDAAWDIINSAIQEYQTPIRCLNCRYGNVCICPKQPSCYWLDKKGNRTACNLDAMRLLYRMEQEGFLI